MFYKNCAIGCKKVDTTKVLYFLNLLNRQTSGHSREIADIYKRALDENDNINHLKFVLNNYVYYREIGNTLYKNGERMLEEIYNNPSKALKILPLLKQQNESIDKAARVSNTLMHSSFPFFEDVSVLAKKDVPAYASALRSIANTSTYLMAVYGGLDAIKDLVWNDDVGIQEMIYAVNTKFLPIFCKVKEPNSSWVITRGHLGGKALFGGDYYYLSYVNTKRLEKTVSELNKEHISTHAFLNVDAYETKQYDVPLFWGIGNIVSVAPEEATVLLKSNVVTKLRSPQMLELSIEAPSPVECARRLSDGKMFCITPDELVLSMNRWQVGYEIEKRKRMHNCLFCGRYVGSGSLICRTHFTVEIR